MVTVPSGMLMWKSPGRGPTHWMSPTNQPATGSVCTVTVPSNGPLSRSPLF
jgi:hypothetical protein